MRSFGLRDRPARVLAMRQHAQQDPKGIFSPWLAAIAFWEEGEAEEANRLAEAILEEQPSDFRMLVICLDWSNRIGDAERTLALARRVVQAKNPSRRLRRLYFLASVLLWPLRLLGFRRDRTLMLEADSFDSWVHWAKKYVESIDQQSHAT